ncbi:MAG: serine/threonine-protein kinase [Acidimicrobiales bacterium]|nr:serine/threonine-protein kinase [Acidimicrobiales bacterium]
MDNSDTGAPGATLDGRFRLDAVLGRGGMATVWSAHDSRLDRTVAIKILHDHLSGEDVERVEREARAAARVTDPRVVTILDLDHTDDGRPYLVFEALSGRTLADDIREHGALAPERLDRLADDLLGGIGAAHSCGVLHRDIKPSNVLVDDDGFRITDFGIASVEDETATQGDLIGTLGYLAPERFDGAPATPAGDVFSASAVLYEAATGRQPFRAATAAETVQRLCAGVHDPLPPTVSPRLRDLISNGLVADPTRRPSAVGGGLGDDSPFVGSDHDPTVAQPTERLDLTQRLARPMAPTADVDTSDVERGPDVHDRVDGIRERVDAMRGRVDDLLDDPRVEDAVEWARRPQRIVIGLGVLLLLLALFAAASAGGGSTAPVDATTEEDPGVLLDEHLDRIEELG